MNPTKFFLAVAIYFVTSFAMGYLWHITIFKSLYDGFMIFGSKTLEPEMLMLVAGTIIEALAFAFLFVRFYSGKRNMLSGITLAVCMYLFTSSYGVFGIAATAKMQGNGVISFMMAELGYMVIAGIVCGGLVGLLVKSKPEARRSNRSRLPIDYQKLQSSR